MCCLLLIKNHHIFIVKNMLHIESQVFLSGKNAWSEERLNSLSGYILHRCLCKPARINYKLLSVYSVSSDFLVSETYLRSHLHATFLSLNNPTSGHKSSGNRLFLALRQASKFWTAHSLLLTVFFRHSPSMKFSSSSRASKP